jgi:release factor glutamine methyltransferase
MNIKQALTEAQQKFNQAGIKTARLDAELILGSVLNKSREYLLTYPENRVSKGQVTNLNHGIMRRLNLDPVAYITGTKDFYGLTFAVTEDVLVPRPETELMIEEAIDLTRTLRHATVIDVGTGSGCIITALAKNLKSIFRYFAIDISPEALKIAKQNAEKNNVTRKVEFFKGDLLEPLINENIVEKDADVLIAANLPYLTPFQVDTSPTIQNEPILALEAGDDGLKYYRQLFKQIVKLKNEKKIKGHVLCEIDPSQNESIQKLSKDVLKISEIEIKKDLAGLDRLAIIKF